MLNIIPSKPKSMKLSDYYEYRKCEYSIIRLVPTKSNKNNNTEQIASLINKMFKQSNKYINQASKKLIIVQKPKVSFYIHITKGKVQFYFIIPKSYLNQFKIKFQEVWKNIEIEEVDNIPMDINSCSKFDLHYKYDESLSLAVDKRNNDLLNSNMTITSMLEENEMVGILYNFIPTSEKESNYFRSNTYPRAIQRYKNGENLKKSKNIKDLSVIALKNFISLINDLLNCILNVPQNNQLILNPLQCEISHSTKRKGEKAICKNQSIILTKSSEKSREIELSNAFSNTFKIISDDNELIVNEITKNIDIKKTIINHVNINKTTIEESSNFISMPSLEVINQFKMIEHNKSIESPVPKELTKGMKLVTTEGTAKKYFTNFPVAVAAKSGTAERNDKIPTANEYEYLMKHLSSYGVKKDEVLKVYQQLRKNREAELTKNKIKEIKEQLKSDDLDEETRAELEKELKDGVDEKLADTDKINAAYLRRAIKKVKPTITDETIDKYKETYGDFAWAVAFAPADDPEIAVAAVVPQGTTSTYAFLPIKDVIGYYMVGSKNSDSNSDNKTDTKNTDKENNSTDKNNSDSINNDNSSATGSDNKLNFNVQIKK